jgi:threonine dehydratase
MIPESDLAAAREVVSSRLAPTPLIYSEHFSHLTGAEIHLKLENLQRTGSFKVRGALCYLVHYRDEIPAKGVIAASAGNHAQGVALAASQLGIPATVVMPENAPIGKQLATRDYGAAVILHGRTVAESLQQARRLEDEGYRFVHPFDDPQVIAGQATVGSEILDQLPASADSPGQGNRTFHQEQTGGEGAEIWVPLGGGGLAAGIALAIAAARQSVRIVGAQTVACPSATAALEAGKPVTVSPGHSIADGIVVPRMGKLPFRILSGTLKEVHCVEESAIALAMVQLLERKKLLAEGAGATALAALLSADPERVRGRRIVVVISGGNVDLNVLDRVLEMGLMHTGRILRFSVVLDDRPGALSSLLNILTREKANILHVSHDRLSVDLPLGRTRVELTAETRGFEHNGQLVAAVTGAGYQLEEEG